MEDPRVERDLVELLPGDSPTLNVAMASYDMS